MHFDQICSFVPALSCREAFDYLLTGVPEKYLFDNDVSSQKA